MSTHKTMSTKARLAVYEQKQIREKEITAIKHN